MALGVVKQSKANTLAVAEAVKQGFAEYATELPPDVVTDIAYDSSNDALLHDTDPHRLAYDAFQDRFGGSELVVIGIEAPEIFDAGFLAKLESFHDQLDEELPHVREITSLINARSTRGEGDVLEVGALLEDWRSREIDADALRASVLSNPVYLNHLISPDGSYTAVVITTQASEQEASSEEDGWHPL